MPEIKIKICGITRIDDAIAALNAGADFIGLNLYAGPRQITVQRAAEIIAATRSSRHVVALVDVSTDDGFNAAAELAAHNAVHIFQLYGNPANAKRLPRAEAQYWPVLRIARRDDLHNIRRWLNAMPMQAHGILLDAFSTRGHGGTGDQIDLSWLSDAASAGEFADLPPMILAGGLNPDNIGAVVASVHPWAVDVSSSVEVAGQPGIKDHAKILAFITAARDAGRS